MGWGFGPVSVRLLKLWLGCPVPVPITSRHCFGRQCASPVLQGRMGKHPVGSLGPWGLPGAEHHDREAKGWWWLPWGRKLQCSTLPQCKGLGCVWGQRKGWSNLFLSPPASSKLSWASLSGCWKSLSDKEEGWNVKCSNSLFWCENVFFISNPRDSFKSSLPFEWSKQNVVRFFSHVTKKEKNSSTQTFSFNFSSPAWPL